MRSLFIQTPVFSGASIYPISCPNRAIISRIVVANTAGSGTATFTLYNRAFTSDVITMAGQGSHTNGKVVLRTDYPDVLPFDVGDTVTVASSSVTGYNTTHVITDRIDAYKVVTDQNYTADGIGGTVTLAIPNVHKPLYTIATATAVSGVATYEPAVWKALVNADALPKGMSVKQNKVYLDAGASGNYRAALTLLLPD